MSTPDTCLTLQLPLGRTAYQTNEFIDLLVIRSSNAALPADELLLELSAEDGSQLSFSWLLPAISVSSSIARASEHLRLNGWLLRPGKYQLHVRVTGAEERCEISLHSHLRQSSFRLIHWGSRAEGEQHIGEGADGLGFNLIYGEDFRPQHNPAHNAECCIIGGSDFMQVCTMSGSHQMDLRPECDWSDPRVTRGGTARVVQQAFANRTMPNCLGVHFYDEPGLTWQDGSPHGVAAQLQAFHSTFGKAAPDYKTVSKSNPESLASWRHWARWRESFMEGAWKEAVAGVLKVKSTLISANQSQYCWNAYTDGCYFNFSRSLPVISGHGGYSDGPASYIYPVYHHEFGRMRELQKAVWYLPTWYNMSSDNFRLEQNMSFMTGLQGMATPPWFNIAEPQDKAEAQGVVECNKMMARLGTIFTTMQHTRGAVALLYSLDQCIDAQIDSGMTDNYEGGGHTRAALLQLYVAGKMLHTNLQPVVEEDILDGTLATHHRALIIGRVNYLAPTVIAALQGYIATGGTVIISDECRLDISGAIKLGVPTTNRQYDLLNELWHAGKQEESLLARNSGDFIREAQPVAEALRAHFTRLGIDADLQVDSSEVFVHRHVSGDFEYLFTLNATYDASKQDRLACKATTTRITLPNDGRPVYNALQGGEVGSFSPLADGQLSASFTFGPGQLRAWARTSHPIAAVLLGSPTIVRDYTLAEEPLQLRITAMLCDNNGQLLNGSAPLKICLRDPLGEVRYQLYRATREGVLQLTLPLAANDAAGEWTVEVTELLALHQAQVNFNYQPAAQCGALVGAQPRAVYFAEDRQHIFDFIRTYQAISIVIGENTPRHIAEQLATSLQPLGVTCTIVDAEAVNKPRCLREDEATSWVGIERHAATPGCENSPLKVGFALDGPAILLGTTADNPLIASISEWGFLPYQATADFPGAGRGYLSWQYQAIGLGQESICCIAGDEVGMLEAIGTLYEAAAGLEPLLPLIPPQQALINAADKHCQPAQLTIRWQIVLPDRPTALQISGDNILIKTNDGTVSTINNHGQLLRQSREKLLASEFSRQVPAEIQLLLLRGRTVKQVIQDEAKTVVLYWGGTIQIFDALASLKYQQQLPFDAVFIALHNNNLLLAMSDGTLLAAKQ